MHPDIQNRHARRERRQRPVKFAPADVEHARFGTNIESFEEKLHAAPAKAAEELKERFDVHFCFVCQRVAGRLRSVKSEKHAHLRRSTFLAAGSVTASAAVTVCALAATALILRVLPRAEAGRFALLVELLYALGVLGTLGQATLQARLYQQAPAGHFDWWQDLRSTVVLTFPALALAVAFLAIPYGLTSFEFVFLLTGSELFVLISCLSAVLAQQQQYAWSSALLRLPNGLLIVPTGLMLLRRSWLRSAFYPCCFSSSPVPRTRPEFRALEPAAGARPRGDHAKAAFARFHFSYRASLPSSRHNAA